MRRQYYDEQMRHLLRHGQFDEVVQRGESLLQTLRSTAGDDCPDVAVLLEDIAAAHYYLRHYDGTVQSETQLGAQLM